MFAEVITFCQMGKYMGRWSVVTPIILSFCEVNISTVLEAPGTAVLCSIAAAVCLYFINM